MKLRIVCAVLLATLVATSASAATSCEELSTLILPDAKIESAKVVSAGTFTPPTGSAAPFALLPAFCRVTATLTPSTDSDIKAEIWLPIENWNGSFQAVGNGGWAGTIPYPALAAAVAAGYAGAGTDTGHTGNNADFALGHPEKLIDLGYRSIHEATVQSKTLINALYDKPASMSYYNGCSQGGRQGLAAAQHYPEDFNGIVVGASALDTMRMHVARTALNLAVNKTPDKVIPPGKYPMIHQAVLNACDENDGLKDGVIENPTMCSFDYAKLQCTGNDAPNCLTAGQVASANAMISPIKDPESGHILYEGHLMPGSELGWATLGGPQPIGLAVSGLRNVVFQDPAWDYHRLEVLTDFERADKADHGVMKSTDSNLKPFFDNGGKLLMYHGWSDPQVNPFTSIQYYDDVLKTVGHEAANSIALFMVPGMNHCQGGAGADTFDKMGTLVQWVEQGVKPTRITAAHLTNGTADRTRPLCPIGQIAQYNGSGDVNQADNFTCMAPELKK